MVAHVITPIDTPILRLFFFCLPVSLLPVSFPTKPDIFGRLFSIESLPHSKGDRRLPQIVWTVGMYRFFSSSLSSTAVTFYLNSHSLFLRICPSATELSFKPLAHFWAYTAEHVYIDVTCTHDVGQCAALPRRLVHMSPTADASRHSVRRCSSNTTPLPHPTSCCRHTVGGIESLIQQRPQDWLIKKKKEKHRRRIKEPWGGLSL